MDHWMGWLQPCIPTYCRTAKDSNVVAFEEDHVVAARTTSVKNNRSLHENEVFIVVMISYVKVLQGNKGEKFVLFHCYSGFLEGGNVMKFKDMDRWRLGVGTFPAKFNPVYSMSRLIATQSMYIHTQQTRNYIVFVDDLPATTVTVLPEAMAVLSIQHSFPHSVVPFPQAS